MVQVPVPPLEPFVRARHAHHDPAYVSSDPDFGHAHVTVLGPWLPEPGDETEDETSQGLAVLGRLAGATPAFDFVLGPAVHSFPDGLLHLRPEPDEPFRALTRAVRAAFPACTPYDGAFGSGEPVPHLTLDHRDEVTATQVVRMLGDLVPARCRAERLDLARWGAGVCAVVASWPLGVRAPASDGARGGHTEQRCRESRSTP